MSLLMELKEEEGHGFLRLLSFCVQRLDYRLRIFPTTRQRGPRIPRDTDIMPLCGAFTLGTDTTHIVERQVRCRRQTSKLTISTSPNILAILVNIAHYTNLHDHFRSDVHVNDWQSVALLAAFDVCCRSLQCRAEVNDCWPL